MNYYLRSAWYQACQLVDNNFQLSVMIASVAVVVVGIYCLRGNIIRR